MGAGVGGVVRQDKNGNVEMVANRKFSPKCTKNGSVLLRTTYEHCRL